jgi:hypothetical protein
MLEKVKLALRINGSYFDSEIQDLIDASSADLQSGGVKIDHDDKLQTMAIIAYCKANYGYEDKDTSERFMLTYQSIKAQICTGGNA